MADIVTKDLMAHYPPRTSKGKHTRLDGLLEAMQIVAEVSGQMKMDDFNDKTWQMLCEINERLAAAATKEASQI